MGDEAAPRGPGRLGEVKGSEAPIRAHGLMGQHPTPACPLTDSSHPRPSGAARASVQEDPSEWDPSLPSEGHRT